MGRAVIRAMIFDLWETVFVDDSEEPKRATQGLLPKLAVRPDLAAGVDETLQNLHGKYRMGVISDAIFSLCRALH